MEKDKVEINFGEESVWVDMDKKFDARRKDVEVNLEVAVLSEKEKGMLKYVINGYSELFSEKPGLTHVAVHEIDCGDSRPIKSKPYRYDKSKDEMLKNNIIYSVDSPWASPVVLCRKKGDLPISDPKPWRFAVYYRALNSVTKFSVYPMPLIEDILHSL